MNPWPISRLKYVRARLDETIAALEEPTPDIVTAYGKLYIVIGCYKELRAVFAELKRKVRTWRATNGSE